jgi:hypothetical protein
MLTLGHATLQAMNGFDPDAQQRFIVLSFCPYEQMHINRGAGAQLHAIGAPATCMPAPT